jgi:FkbM family methyltransferase
VLRFIKALLPGALKEWFRRRFLYRNSMALSQAGQDYWVWAEAFNEMRDGYFVDIGAFDGLNISNTFLLEARYGWRGICIEANPVRFADLRRNRACICLNACLDRTEGEVSFVMREELGGIAGLTIDPRAASHPGETIRMPTRTLSSVLLENNAPAIIDYLSIDVEGAEDRILLDFDFDSYRFNTMTIERPSAALRELLKARGYWLVREIPHLDCFYVHHEFWGSYLNNLYSFYRHKRQLYVRWR